MATIDLPGKMKPARSTTSDMPETAVPAPAPVLAVSSEGSVNAEAEAALKAKQALEPPKVEEPPKAEEPPKEKSGLQKRFSELTGDVKEAEAKAAEAEAKAAAEAVARAAAEAKAKELETKLTESIAKLEEGQSKIQRQIDAAGDPKPVRAAYTDPDSYDRDLEQWVERNVRRQVEVESQTKAKETEAEKAAREAAEQQATAAAEAKAIAERWADSRKKASEKYSDFSQKAEGAHWEPTPAMYHVITQSDAGAELAYHLGSNPDLVKEIAKLPNWQQVMRLGALSVELAGRPPEVSKVPPPLDVPAGGEGAPKEKSPSEMSMEEYEAYYKERTKRK